MLENGQYRATIQVDGKVRVDQMYYDRCGTMPNPILTSSYVNTYKDLEDAIHYTFMARMTITKAFKIHKDGKVEEIRINRDRTYTVIRRVPQIGDPDWIGSQS